MNLYREKKLKFAIEHRKNGQLLHMMYNYSVNIRKYYTFSCLTLFDTQSAAKGSQGRNIL